MATGFKKATVASAKVAATQTNFPSYVDLSRLGITTQAEADSVRVYADESKTTEWAREIVSATEMHVKIPSLTSTTDMYVDWDGARSDYTTTATYGAEAVWSDYMAVYHMQHSSGDATDSTGNGRTLTNNNSVTYASAQIENGSVYAKASKKNLSNSTNFVGAATSGVTTTAWVKVMTLPTNGYWSPVVMASGGDSPYVSHQLGFYQYPTNTWTWVWGRTKHGVASSFTLTDATTPVADTWYKLTGTTDGTSRAEFYKDGTSLASTGSVDTGSGTNGTNAYRGFILGRENYTGDDSNNRYLDGVLDEVRIKTGAVTDDWETTEYNNQSDESTFWGTWTDAGGATATFTPKVTIF